MCLILLQSASAERLLQQIASFSNHLENAENCAKQDNNGVTDANFLVAGIRIDQNPQWRVSKF